jgi:hypothetical protein
MHKRRLAGRPEVDVDDVINAVLVDISQRLVAIADDDGNGRRRLARFCDPVHGRDESIAAPRQGFDEPRRRRSIR